MAETTTKCPHCGFESEDDEMCRACGETMFEDASPTPKAITASPPSTTVCPHCGFKSEDDEICQACGALFEDNTPVRDVSFAQVVGGFFSWLQDKGFHGVAINTYNTDVSYVNDDLFYDSSDDHDEVIVNPANGLLMIGGISGIDIEGNPYGIDSNADDLFPSSNS